MKASRQERVLSGSLGQCSIWLCSEKGTQPGQPRKLHHKRHSPGRQLPRSLHRATARGVWGHTAGRSGRPGSGWAPLLLPAASTRPPRLGGSLLGLLGGSAPGGGSLLLLPGSHSCQALLRLPPAAGWTPGWEGREELHVSPAQERGSGSAGGGPQTRSFRLWDGAGSRRAPCPGPPASVASPENRHRHGLQGSHDETHSSLARPAVGTATRFHWHHDL